MVKHYNTRNFYATIDGKTYMFHAYTTYTRNGFCHTVSSYDLPITDSKCSYINRTWERFDYESALKKAISKIADKELKARLYAILIEGKAEEEHKKAEAFVAAFSGAFNSLSDKGKETIANLAGEDGIQSEGQAQALLAAAQLGAVMGM